MLEKIDELMKTIAQLDRFEEEFFLIRPLLGKWDASHVDDAIRRAKSKLKREARKTLANTLDPEQ